MWDDIGLVALIVLPMRKGFIFKKRKKKNGDEKKRKAKRKKKRQNEPRATPDEDKGDRGSKPQRGNKAGSKLGDPKFEGGRMPLDFKSDRQLKNCR